MIASCKDLQSKSKTSGESTGTGVEPGSSARAASGVMSFVSKCVTGNNTCKLHQIYHGIWILIVVDWMNTLTVWLNRSFQCSFCCHIITAVLLNAWLQAQQGAFPGRSFSCTSLCGDSFGRLLWDAKETWRWLGGMLQVSFWLAKWLHKLINKYKQDISMEVTFVTLIHRGVTLGAVKPSSRWSFCRCWAI